MIFFFFFPHCGSGIDVKLKILLPTYWYLEHIREEMLDVKKRKEKLKMPSGVKSNLYTAL